MKGSGKMQAFTWLLDMIPVSARLAILARGGTGKHRHGLCRQALSLVRLVENVDKEETELYDAKLTVFIIQWQVPVNMPVPTTRQAPGSS